MYGIVDAKKLPEQWVELVYNKGGIKNEQ